MQLHIIETGNFKLDGGAMFGVVPKSLWSRRHPADDKNMCTWSMRCLLIEEGDRLVLIDTGIGDKQDDKFFSFYYLHGEDSLDKSLKAKGFHPNDVTDVFLTHLHFDHCGGALIRNGEKIVPKFPNAKYWSNEEHWNWATKPNPREKASFLKENILPIQESGQLNFIEFDKSPFEFMDIIYVDGHTEKQMLPVIHYKDKKIVFCADLLPSAHHVPIPWVMAYDTRPLLTMNEKTEFLERAILENYILFFEHDANNQCGNLEKTEKGIRLNQTFKLSEVL
ncbi:MBL fold metallo-hydrolase [Hyphobacterium sp. CCMP332]|nr:MBL fold metallo-hydrolase [Hyphobacterium sp. CCMP332]